MSWPNPFRRRTPNTIDHYGYVFEWTDDHLTEEECAPLRHSYDELGEKVLNRLNEISPPPKRHELPKDVNRPSTTTEESKVDTKAELNSEVAHQDIKEFPLPPTTSSTEKPPTPTRDLYAILKENHTTDPLLSQFWDEVTTVPSWVDWDQISRGQDVFYRYGGANLTGLAYQSLLGGMGAHRVVETLARTGGFSVKVARHRLFETTQHILQVTKSLDSIKPLGDGWASTLRVRLLHAAVRNRILALEKSKPGYYNIPAYGVPINDLDSIATITTFSATLLYLSLPRQGIFPRPQECKDYIALWRYIAHVIGCPTTPYFANPDKALAVMQSLYYYEIRPSPTSRIMANNVIKSLAGQPPAYASVEFLSASARWLNGNALGDELGLVRPSIYYSVLMAGQCIFFCALIYTNRSVESWDRKKIELLKKVFWDVVVGSKYGLQGKETGFEFRYVPEYSTVTEMGEGSREKGEYSVESRNLRWVGYAAVIAGVGVYVGLRLTGFVWGKMF